MTRLSLFLLVAVIASAMLLVRTQYESRRLFVELDQAQALAHRLDIERDRLELEKRGQATPLRVERLAHERLEMRSVTPALTDYVTLSTPDKPKSTAAQGGRP